MWDFAGSKYNLREAPKQAVIRETKEETLYDINLVNEIRKEKYSDEKHNFLFHYFIPEIISRELTLSLDYSDFMWIFKERLKNFKLHPSIKFFD